MPAGIEFTPVTLDRFADSVISWFESHGRHDLPWQTDPSPYRVWVSEIMLQQTQVGTVFPYYQRFMARFPDVATLARADIDQVLHLWTGLGYYARARNMHKAARAIVETCRGRFPDTVEELIQLSGIGRSTAGAILALAHHRPAPILDGNVKRVLARCFAVEGYPGNSKVQSELWALAERLLPRQMDDSRGGRIRSRIAAYTQGMMDLGATLCTRGNPDCLRCPLQSRCLAWQRGEIDRYPGKKPAKALPVRSVTMFILQDHEGRVLLEKRPPNGVWGSLYSLPEVDHGKDGTHGRPPPNSVRATGGRPTCVALTLPSGLPVLRFENEPPHQLEPITHGFTHFKLNIVPLRLRVESVESGAADSDRWLWYSIDDPAEVGLAAPVKRLLMQLEESDSSAATSKSEKEQL